MHRPESVTFKRCGKEGKSGQAEVQLTGVVSQVCANRRKGRTGCACAKQALGPRLTGRASLTNAAAAEIAGYDSRSIAVFRGGGLNEQEYAVLIFDTGITRRASRGKPVALAQACPSCVALICT